ncbi:hypothetical protein ACLMJK_003416 [Lecanora helva]
MASMSPVQDAILYQNPSKTIVLLDIPRSISFAQGTPSHPCTGQIISSPAPETPFPSTEPKTSKARARLLEMKLQEDPSTQFPEQLLQRALEGIRAQFDGVWCLERKVSPTSSPKQDRKRKFDKGSLAVTTAYISTDVVSEKHETSDLSTHDFGYTIDLFAFSNASRANPCPNVNQLANCLCYNPCPHPVFFKHTDSHSQLPITYMIPPNASFLLSKINSETALAMSMATLTMYPEASATADRGQFDFILLDPPWENRSARRSAKYDTMRDPEPMEVLQNILGQHIAENGLVACWITNKASVRYAALEAFEVWDVHVIEEWAWLKVTTKGEPVTPLDGLWRKPYEILLLGRKRALNAEQPSQDLLRRVIVGVPDFHSRKPNIKALMEPMLPANCRAQEIFARNLTAEGFAWGDEVLKYAA